jgi:hypothetical protein
VVLVFYGWFFNLSSCRSRTWTCLPAPSPHSLLPYSTFSQVLERGREHGLATLVKATEWHSNLHDNSCGDEVRFQFQYVDPNCQLTLHRPVVDHSRVAFDDESDFSDHNDSNSTKPYRKNQKKVKSKSETRKVAFGQNRARAFWHFLLFHAVPLAGAYALVVLNFQGRYWGTSGSYISFLQFVAKVHEILMQASIGVVCSTVFLSRENMLIQITSEFRFCLRTFKLCSFTNETFPLVLFSRTIRLAS